MTPAKQAQDFEKFIQWVQARPGKPTGNLAKYAATWLQLSLIIAKAGRQNPELVDLLTSALEVPVGPNEQNGQNGQSGPGYIVQDPGLAQDYEKWTPARRLKWNLNALRAIRYQTTSTNPIQLQRAVQAYTGWGGFTRVLDHLPASEGLFDAKTEEAIRAWQAGSAAGWVAPPDLKVVALDSALSSQYFTPLDVCGTMWGHAVRLCQSLNSQNGSNLSVLEPSAGIGRMLYAMPKDLIPLSAVTAFEYDVTLAKLLKFGNAEATVYANPFEAHPVAPDNDLAANSSIVHYDIVISNPPFDERDNDLRSYDAIPKLKSQTRAEKYFLLKSLELLKPGGIMMMLTPESMVKSKTKDNIEYRKNMYKWGDFRGAFTLPASSFPSVPGVLIVQAWTKRAKARSAAEATVCANLEYIYPAENALGQREVTSFQDRETILGNFDSAAASQAVWMPAEQNWGFFKEEEAQGGPQGGPVVVTPPVGPRRPGRPPGRPPKVVPGTPPATTTTTSPDAPIRIPRVDYRRLDCSSLGSRLTTYYSRLNNAAYLSLAEVGREELIQDLATFAKRWGQLTQLDIAKMAQIHIDAWMRYYREGITTVPLVSLSEFPAVGSTILATIQHYCRINGYCTDKEIISHFPDVVNQDNVLGIAVDQGAYVEPIPDPVQLEAVRKSREAREERKRARILAQLENAKTKIKNISDEDDEDEDDEDESRDSDDADDESEDSDDSDDSNDSDAKKKEDKLDEDTVNAEEAQKKAHEEAEARDAEEIAAENAALDSIEIVGYLFYPATNQVDSENHWFSGNLTKRLENCRYIKEELFESYGDQKTTLFQKAYAGFTKLQLLAGSSSIYQLGINPRSSLVPPEILLEWGRAEIDSAIDLLTDGVRYRAVIWGIDKNDDEVQIDASHYLYNGFNADVIIDTNNMTREAKRKYDSAMEEREQLLRRLALFLGYLNRETQVLLSGFGERMNIYPQNSGFEGRMDIDRSVEESFTRWLQLAENAHWSELLLRVYNESVPQQRGRIYSTDPYPIARQTPMNFTPRRHQNQTSRWQLDRVGGFLFDAVGAGKSRMALASFAIWRQSHRAKRCIFIAPTATLPQFYRDSLEFLPDMRICFMGTTIVPTDKGNKVTFDSTEQRKAKWEAFRDGCYDLMVVGHSGFMADLYPNKNTIIEVVSNQVWMRRGFVKHNEERAALIEKIKGVEEKLASQIENKRKGWEKTVEKTREELVKLKKALSEFPELSDKEVLEGTKEIINRSGTAFRPTGAANLLPYEEVVGPDVALIIDEAHAYKNLWYPGPRGGASSIEFLGATKKMELKVKKDKGDKGKGKDDVEDEDDDDVENGDTGTDETEGEEGEKKEKKSEITKLCWDLLFKTQHLFKVRGDRQGVMLMTATPLKNSPLELYNLGCYVSPDLWKRAGIYHAEEYIDRFLVLEEVNTASVMDLTPKVGPGVVGFQERPAVDLMSMLAPLMQRRTKEFLVREGILELPRRVMADVGIPMAQSQAQITQGLKKVAQLRIIRKLGKKKNKEGEGEDIESDDDDEGDVNDTDETLKQTMDNFLKEFGRIPFEDRNWNFGREAILGFTLMSLFTKVALDPRLLAYDWYRYRDTPEDQRKVKRGRKGANEDPMSDDMSFVYTHIFSVMRSVGVRIPEDFEGIGQPPPEKYLKLAQMIKNNAFVGPNGQAIYGSLVFSDSIESHKWIIEALVNVGVPKDRIATLDASKKKQLETIINGTYDADGQPLHAGFNGRRTVTHPDTGEVLAYGSEPGWIMPNGQQFPGYDVLIGTDFMSTGLNLQRRCGAIYHLTFKWEPATIEQREGRAIRQGNEWWNLPPNRPGSIPISQQTVAVNYMYAERSFDSILQGKAEGKAEWQNEVFNGNAPDFRQNNDDREQKLIQFLFDDPAEAARMYAKVRAEHADKKRRSALKRAWALWTDTYNGLSRSQFEFNAKKAQATLQSTIAAFRQADPKLVAIFPESTVTGMLQGEIVYPDVAHQVSYRLGENTLIRKKIATGKEEEFRVIITKADVGANAITFYYRHVGELALKTTRLYRAGYREFSELQAAKETGLLARDAAVLNPPFEPTPIVGTQYTREVRRTSSRWNYAKEVEKFVEKTKFHEVFHALISNKVGSNQLYDMRYAHCLFGFWSKYLGSGSNTSGVPYPTYPGNILNSVNEKLPQSVIWEGSTSRNLKLWYFAQYLEPQNSQFGDKIILCSGAVPARIDPKFRVLTPKNPEDLELVFDAILSEKLVLSRDFNSGLVRPDELSWEQAEMILQSIRTLWNTNCTDKVWHKISSFYLDGSSNRSTYRMKCEKYRMPATTKVILLDKKQSCCDIADFPGNKANTSLGYCVRVDPEGVETVEKIVDKTMSYLLSSAGAFDASEPQEKVNFKDLGSDFNQFVANLADMVENQENQENQGNLEGNHDEASLLEKENPGYSLVKSLLLGETNPGLTRKSINQFKLGLSKMLARPNLSMYSCVWDVYRQPPETTLPEILIGNVNRPVLGMTAKSRWYTHVVWLVQCALKSPELIEMFNDPSVDPIQLKNVMAHMEPSFREQAVSRFRIWQAMTSYRFSDATVEVREFITALAGCVINTFGDVVSIKKTNTFYMAKMAGRSYYSKVDVDMEKVLSELVFNLIQCYPEGLESLKARLERERAAGQTGQEELEEQINELDQDWNQE